MKRAWEHDFRLLKLKREADRDQAEADIARAETEGSFAGLKASIQADAEVGESYRWVAAVRGLTRPALTFVLWLIGLLVFFASTHEARQDFIDAVVFAATTATVWWFGDRYVSKMASRQEAWKTPSPAPVRFAEGEKVR